MEFSFFTSDSGAVWERGLKAWSRREAGEQVRNAGRREPPDSGGQGFEERKTETRPGRRETEAQASDLAETGRSRNNPDELPGSPTNQISEGTTQGF